MNYPDYNNRNKAAFPCESSIIERQGMTKREYFALKSMISIMSNPHERGTIEQIAEGSVKMADALIEALNK